MKIFKTKFENGMIKYYFLGVKFFAHKPNIHKMRLGISYSLFDGVELLESSLRAIRPSADYINVIYQDFSYVGKKADENLHSILQHFKEQGLINEFFLYNTQQKKPEDMEKEKRNIGLKLAKKAKCTHFMSMDVDEYYRATEIESAKQWICLNHIKSSAVTIIEYLKDPTYQMMNNFTFNVGKDFYTFYVPFIMKIYKFKRQEHGDKNFPCLVDPTRGLNGNDKFYLFPAHDISMHHMSSIRKDLSKKYTNSNLIHNSHTTDKTAKEVFNLQQSILDFDFHKNQEMLKEYSMFDKSLIRKVENEFNIVIKN